MKLLVAVDGSEQALEAARHALRLREAGLKAEIVLAAVQEPSGVLLLMGTSCRRR